MAEAGKLSKEDWTVIRLALLAQEKSYRRLAGKYQAEGRLAFKKLVDADLASLARVLMLVGE